MRVHVHNEAFVDDMLTVKVFGVITEDGVTETVTECFGSEQEALVPPPDPEQVQR